MLDGDDQTVAIVGAPVYRRTIILEFLDHELQRVKQFNSVFSVLLAEYIPSATDQRDNHPTEWLIRLRQCLRAVDLIGQVADAVYVVILPQTRKRAAEALRQRISAELGPDSPLTLSTMEIAEQRQLGQIFARRKALDG